MASDPLDELEVGQYSRWPKFGVPQTLTAAQQMVTAVPTKAPAPVKKAVARTRVAVDRLAERWLAQRTAVKSDGRPIDAQADTAWSAACQRTEGAASLPVDRYSIAVKATRLLPLLFPDRLAFTQLEYVAQWQEMEHRRRLLDGANGEPGLRADFIAVVGEEVNAEVVRSHKAYAEMIGVSEPRDSAPAARVAGLLTELRQAMRGLSVQLLAWVDDEPQQLDTVRGALRPLDDLRESQRASREPSPPPDGVVAVGAGEEPDSGPRLADSPPAELTAGS